MAWLFEFDFGLGFVDRTSYVKGEDALSRRMEIHQNLQPTTNECSFRVGPDATLYNALLQGGSDIPVRITKDGTRWFAGILQRTAETSVTGSLQPMTLKVYDPGIKLKRKLTTVYKRMGATASTVVTELLALAGISDQSVSTISTVIDTVSFDQSTTYWDAITKVLSALGWVLYFDANGTARTYDLFPGSLTSTKTYSSGASGNMLDELTVVRKLRRFGGCRLTYYRHESKSGIVFDDTTGGNDAHPCNIALSGYPRGYPDREVSSDTVYAQYSFTEGGVKYEVLGASGVSWVAEGGTLAESTDYGTKAALKVTGSGTLTKLRASASVVIVKGAKVIKEALILGSTDDTENIETDLIGTDADALRLVSGRKAYWENSPVSFSFKTDDTVALGAVVTLVDASLGYNLLAIVVGFTEDEWGIKKVWLEAAQVYVAASVTNRTEVEMDPRGAPGISPVTVGLSTYGILRSAAGAYTPPTLTPTAIKAGASYPVRFRAYANGEAVPFYESTADESTVILPVDGPALVRDWDFRFGGAGWALDTAATVVDLDNGSGVKKCLQIGPRTAITHSPDFPVTPGQAFRLSVRAKNLTANYGLSGRVRYRNAGGTTPEWDQVDFAVTDTDWTVKTADVTAADSSIVVAWADLLPVAVGSGTGLWAVDYIRVDRLVSGKPVGTSSILVLTYAPGGFTTLLDDDTVTVIQEPDVAAMVPVYTPQFLGEALSDPSGAVVGDWYLKTTSLTVGAGNSEIRVLTDSGWVTEDPVSDFHHNGALSAIFRQATFLDSGSYVAITQTSHVKRMYAYEITIDQGGALKAASGAYRLDDLWATFSRVRTIGLSVETIDCGVYGDGVADLTTLDCGDYINTSPITMPERIIGGGDWMEG